MSFLTLAPYAGLLGLLYLYLCWRVIRVRQARKINFGDGGDEELARAMRVQANFNEYVPLILLLLLALAALHFSRYLIDALGILLVIGRLLHAQGLGHTSGRSFGREVGTGLTWLVLLVAAVALILGTILPMA